ncbi:MAG: ion transporter, partial [Betaproteobacteria bacterium]|nr:ion transporter [Betaproteobacteria bacterium]
MSSTHHAHDPHKAGHHGHHHKAAHHAHGQDEGQQAPALPPPEGIRGNVYAALFDPNRPGNLQPFIDNFTMALIIAIPFALLFESVPEVYDANKDLFHFFDMFSLGVFTIEYVLRLYTAPEMEEFKGKSASHFRWMIMPMSLIDLAAILPFYLSLFLPLNVGALRAIRLLRLAKLSRILIPAIQEFAHRNKGKTARQKVHALIFQTPTSGKLHVLLDNFLVIWVLISVLAVILETVPSIHDILVWEFKLLDYIAVAIFSVEYVLRLYSVPEEPEFKHRYDSVSRLTYAKSRNAIIDLLAVLPFFLEVFL